MGCQDYARVDFRVDEAGQPFILEVNPNPCISPLAGLAAALETAKIPYGQFIVGLVQSALARGPKLQLASSFQFRPVDEATASSPPNPTSQAEVTASNTNPAPVHDTRERFRGVLREARKTDLLRIRETLATQPLLLGRSVAHWLAWWDRLSQWGLPPDSKVFVAYRRKICVGVAVVRLEDDQQGNALVDFLWVAPDQRRLGLGQALLQACESACVAQSRRQLVLQVPSGASEASLRQFLVASQFRPVAEWPDYYQDGSARIAFGRPCPPLLPPATEATSQNQAAS